MTDPNVPSNQWDDATPSSLLVRVKEQNPVAWDRLVALYGPLVYKWCRQAGLQAADAEDVGQEVFRAVARRIGAYHHDREADTFRGWLRTITRNKIRDWARHRPPERPGLLWVARMRRARKESWDVPELDDKAAAAERSFVYLRALDLIREDFQERTWQAFWQVTVDGVPSADVAVDLDMSLNAVYLARSRVLRRLRQEFEGLLDAQ
jgi:RNA polymerase sigma-70 factor (ECF subfamily)